MTPPRRQPRYAVVHVRPDGTPHPAGEHVGSWREALAHGQHVRDVLRAEAARGHAEAGGEVWIVDDRRGAVVQVMTIAPTESESR